MPWRRVETRIWNDAWFRSLSSQGKLLWMYLLTNTSTTPIPGLYAAGEMQLAEGLGWSLDEFRKAFHEAFPEASREAYAQASTEGATTGLFEGRDNPRVKVDFKARVVWIRRAARHDPPASPNVIRSWARVVHEQLPECQLIYEALRGIRDVVLANARNRKAFEAAFADAFPDLFGRPPKALPEGLPEDMPSTRPRNQTQKPDPEPPPPTSSSRPPPDGACGGGEEGLAEGRKRWQHALETLRADERPYLADQLEATVCAIRIEGDRLVLDVPSKEGAAWVRETYQALLPGAWEVREVDPNSAPAPGSLATSPPAEPAKTAEDAWQELQRLREQERRKRETKRPKGFSEWWAEVATNGAVFRAYVLYLQDSHFKGRGHPTAIFMSPRVYEPRLLAS